MPKRRLVLLALALPLLLAAGWLGLWFWSAGQLETAVARFAEQQRARGLTVSYQGPEIGGFPAGLSAAFGAPRVAGRDGWRWSGPAVSGRAQVWSPFTIESSFPGLHRIAFRPGPQAPETQLEAEASEAESRVELRRDGRIERAAVALGGLTLRPPAVGPATAERLALRYGPSRPGRDGRLPEIDMSLGAGGIVLPPEIRIPLGPRIETAGLEATLVGEIPPGEPKEALARWREAGGSLEVHRLATDWGPLSLEAEGTASLDDKFRPIGAFTARARGLLETLDALARAGAIEPGAALAARIAVAALGGGAGGAGIEVPITLQNGRVYLGPVPLARLSPVL